MDTTYIKMCDCEEIQALNPNTPENKVFEQGNWYSHHGGEPFVEDYDYIVAGATWLPLQNQLQDMVKLPRSKLVTEFYTFAICHEVKNVLALNYYRSMEQLWLAFVMKEKYNKVWDNGWKVLE